MYQDEFIEVIQDEVIQPDGAPGTYATVKMKQGVSILPLDEDGMVYLIRQFRYALGRESLEVVSGGMDGDEAPLEAAKREIREEIGLEAAEWHELGVVDLDTSIVHGPVYLFLARDLKPVGAQQEGTETIEPVKMTVAEAVEQVFNGGISHGPTCIVILKAAHTL